MARIVSVVLVAMLASLSLFSPEARADEATSLRIRQVGASSRLIGCSRYIMYCEGIVTSRFGLSVVEIGTPLRGRVRWMGMFQASGRPEDDLAVSQTLVGAGPRLVLGRSWVQAGAGIAASRVGRNPKTLTSRQLLRDPAPALLGGVGTSLDVGVLLLVSIDASTSIGNGGNGNDPLPAGTVVDESRGVMEPRATSRIYQVSATVSHTF